MSQSCYRSVSNTHGGYNWTHRDTTCLNCGKVGHLVRVYLSGARGEVEDAGPSEGGEGGRLDGWRHTVWKAQCVESETDEQIWEITTAAPTPRNPYKAALTVNGTPLTMVIDTGALIPRRPCFPNCPQLCTYAAEPIGTVRQAKVTVGYKSEERDRPC